MTTQPTAMLLLLAAATGCAGTVSSRRTAATDRGEIDRSNPVGAALLDFLFVNCTRACGV